MRQIVLCLACASPAAAWEFSATPVCTLTGPQTVVTYDTAVSEYSITVTNPAGPWPDSPSFAISFVGAAPNVIGTNRHTRAGADLTVRDRGFGNVLDGLGGNDFAVAVAGDARVTIPLAGIGPALVQFRACPADALS